MTHHMLAVLIASVNGVVCGLVSIAAAVRGDRRQSTTFTLLAVLQALATVVFA